MAFNEQEPGRRILVSRGAVLEMRGEARKVLGITGMHFSRLSSTVRVTLSGSKRAIASKDGHLRGIRKVQKGTKLEV